MRYIIGALVFVVLLILLIVFVFRPGSKPQPAINKPVTLTDYAYSGDVLKVTIDGPVVSTEKHRAVRISVDADSRQLEVMTGYNQDILRSKTYSNDSAAFNVFIRALQQANFSKNNKDSNTTDERGYCPIGNRFIYELDDPSGNHILRLWSDSCSDKAGTFAGNGPLIRQLFEAQIPDYTAQTQDVNLSNL